MNLKQEKHWQIAIKKEYILGLNNLPSISYEQFFRKPLQNILDLPIKAEKDWFETIRKTSVSKDDEFSKKGLDWKNLFLYNHQNMKQHFEYMTIFTISYQQTGETLDNV